MKTTAFTTSKHAIEIKAMMCENSRKSNWQCFTYLCRQIHDWKDTFSLSADWKWKI